MAPFGLLLCLNFDRCCGSVLTVLLFLTGFVAQFWQQCYEHDLILIINFFRKIMCATYLKIKYTSLTTAHYRWNGWWLVYRMQGSTSVGLLLHRWSIRMSAPWWFLCNVSFYLAGICVLLLCFIHLLLKPVYWCGVRIQKLELNPNLFCICWQYAKWMVLCHTEMILKIAFDQEAVDQDVKTVWWKNTSSTIYRKADLGEWSNDENLDVSFLSDTARPWKCCTVVLL